MNNDKREENEIDPTKPEVEPVEPSEPISPISPEALGESSSDRYPNKNAQDFIRNDFKDISCKVNN